MMRLLDLAHKAHLVDKPVNDCDGNFGRARLAYFAETSAIRKAYLRAANSTLAEPAGISTKTSYIKLTTPAAAKTVVPLTSFRPLNTVKRARTGFA